MGDDRVDLWATDEVHFQQHGSRCRMWIPPETKDPVIYHQPTRRSVGYFGAVRLRDGSFFCSSRERACLGRCFGGESTAIRSPARTVARNYAILKVRFIAQPYDAGKRCPDPWVQVDSNQG